MDKVIKLNIITPGRETISKNIVSLITAENDGRIEILSNHVPIIVATVPTISTYKTADGEVESIFTSQGIIYIKNNEINFCCDSVNFKDEIDFKRAEEAKNRALKRLGDKKNIDEERAKRALSRALARLEFK